MTERSWQHDVYNLQKWSQIWQLSFDNNYKFINFMLCIFERNNPERDYFCHGDNDTKYHLLPSGSDEKDLGVLFQDFLNSTSTFLPR